MIYYSQVLYRINLSYQIQILLSRQRSLIFGVIQRRTPMKNGQVQYKKGYDRGRLENGTAV